MNYDTCPDYFRGRYLRDRGDLIQARLSAVCGHRNGTGSGTTAKKGPGMVISAGISDPSK